MNTDINGYPIFSDDSPFIQKKEQQKQDIKKDFNNYPEVQLDNNFSVQQDSKQNLIIEPLTKIIYQTGGATTDIATRTKLGIVKIGNDLDITAQGLLSASVHIDNLLQNEYIIFDCGSSTLNI